MSLIGLDVGTTGCKVIIFDETGRVLSQASREYSILTPQPPWAEQDAEQVWKLAWEALQEAVGENPGGPPRAVALSVQGEAVIAVDDAGRALRHAILGMDTRSPTLDDALRAGGISVYRHVVPGLYLAMTLNHSGGLLLRWFRDTFGKWEIEQARRTGSNAYDLILADAPKGPTSLMVLPHFAGSGTPTLDTSSKGAVLGLTFAADLATVAKAILEGLTFELRINLDLLRASGVAIRELHAVGGGARSPLWLQLKADIGRVPLRVPQVTEAACLGAALLAGAACGVYRDLEAAVGQAVRLGHEVKPDPQSVPAYDKRFEVYSRIYPILKHLHA